MRFSIPFLSSALLIPVFLGSETGYITAEPIVKDGLKLTSASEYTPDVYERLESMLLKSRRTKPFRQGFAPKGSRKTNLRKMTNAQRLATGQPPNPPVARYAMHHRQDLAAVPDTILAPSEFYVAQVEDGSTGAMLGYISLGMSVSGQFEITADWTSAIEFQVASVDTDSLIASPLKSMRIEAALAPVDDMPVLSLINGPDNVDANLGPGSWHYLHVGTSQTASHPGTPPAISANTYTAMTGIVTATESDVWSIDSTTGALSAVWVNEDGSEVPVHLYVQNGALLALGDPAAFQERYTDPITPLVWKMVVA